MDYYDGNTVTALWNYAQRYAMSDNFYNTTFGPSALGAINLVSGQTHGVVKKFTPGGGFPDDYVIDNAYSIPLLEDTQVFAVAPRVQGFENAANSVPWFYNAWIDDTRAGPQRPEGIDGVDH